MSESSCDFFLVRCEDWVASSKLWLCFLQTSQVYSCPKQTRQTDTLCLTLSSNLSLSLCTECIAGKWLACPNSISVPDFIAFRVQGARLTQRQLRLKQKFHLSAHGTMRRKMHCRRFHWCDYCVAGNTAKTCFLFLDSSAVLSREPKLSSYEFLTIFSFMKCYITVLLLIFFINNLQRCVWSGWRITIHICMLGEQLMVCVRHTHTHGPFSGELQGTSSIKASMWDWFCVCVFKVGRWLFRKALKIPQSWNAFIEPGAAAIFCVLAPRPFHHESAWATGATVSRTSPL